MVDVNKTKAVMDAILDDLPEKINSGVRNWNELKGRNKAELLRRTPTKWSGLWHWIKRKLGWKGG